MNAISTRLVFDNSSANSNKFIEKLFADLPVTCKPAVLGLATKCTVEHFFKTIGA